MKPFIASEKAVAQLLATRKAPVWEPPQLNFTSTRAAPDDSESGDIVKAAIGEGVIRALGMIALHGGARKPGLARVRVATRGSFVPEVAETLATRFGLAPASCAANGALSILADELYEWASREPFVRADLGIEVDEKAGAVFVRCPSTASVLRKLRK